MYIYLDERGDLGFDFSKAGTSRKFVITLLVCKTQDVKRAIKKAVTRTIKNKLNKRRKVKQLCELKGTRTTLSVKRYFLKQLDIDSDDWELYTVVLNKKHVSVEFHPVKGQNKPYNFLTRFLIEKLPLRTVYSNVHLIVDRSKNMEEIREFNRYLQSHIEGLLPLKTGFYVEHLNSHEDAGLQAEDLFCWGIGRKYELNDLKWYECFREKIVFETEYLRDE